MAAMMTVHGGNFGMSSLAKALRVVSTVRLYIKIYAADEWLMLDGCIPNPKNKGELEC
jgi:hypothetical protein